jgi:serine/threonine protein kinase
MSSDELKDYIKEIIRTDPTLYELFRKASPYFVKGDEDYETLSLYIQAMYGENDLMERAAALREYLTEFLTKKETKPNVRTVLPYIEDLVIQTSYWKPYLILFKCRYGDKKAFGKLFILGDEDTSAKYQTERDINTKILEPLLTYTQNIPRLLHIDEAVDGKAFYNTVKGHLLEKHRKYLEGTLARAPKNAHLLLYEDVGDHPLKTYLNKLTDVDMKKTLVQLFATVHLLHQHGICHGDLFARTNIMLRKLDVPRTLTYMVEGKQYIVRDIRWMLTIIDFDLSGRMNACEDYTIVTESIQSARKTSIPFPETLLEAIDLFGKPYLVSTGGRRKRKTRRRQH